MKIKRLLCGLMAIMIAAPLLTMTAFATKHTIVADGLTIEDNKNKSSYSDGVVTITGPGGLLGGSTNTVTIKNIGSIKANIIFDYEASGYSSFSESAASGTINTTLAAGATRDMTIKGKGGYKDATLTLSNIVYTPIIEGPATITYNELGSVTVNGSAFTSGSTTGTLTETGAALVATPVSGASFVAWVNADNNEVLSQNATFQLKPYAASMNIKAVFSKATDPAYYMTNSIMYNDLNAAITAASSGDKKVVVMSSGKVTAGTTYNIPSGVALLVPYSTADYKIGSSTVIDESGCSGELENANVFFGTKDNDATYGGTAAAVAAVTGVMEPDTSVTYTLTIPSGTTLNVSGKLVVGGTLVAGTYTTTGICGATGGAHSNIQMDGTINVKSGGVLSTYGYIRGDGTITAESGGAVYQPFIIMDHKDGHYLYAAKQNDRWPVYRYSIQNIQCPLVLNSGSDMYGYSAVFTRKNSFAAARFNPSVVRLVGSDNETAIFLLNSGTMTMTYERGKTLSVTSSTNNNTKGYYSKVGRTTMTFNGNVALGNITLSVVVVGSNYNMNSQNSEIPVPYNFNLVQESGTFSVANNMALLPGATFTVENGAFMTVDSGKSLVIYDGLRDYATRAESVTLDGDDQTGGTWPLYHYPTADNLQSGGFSRTAELIVNGTLTVNGNLGGTVQTEGTTGKIVMGSSAGTSATGTFGVQNASVNVVVMTIAGSCGKTVRTLDAQVFTAHSKEPIKLQKNKNYVVSGAGPNTLTGYSYSVYAASSGNPTTESKTNLKATVVGTWKCETCTEVIDAAVAATCTEPGLTEGKHCSVCNVVIVAQTVVDALGHSYTSVVTPPTCTEDGYTTHTCLGCGDRYTDNPVATAGHSWTAVNGGYVCAGSCSQHAILHEGTYKAFTLNVTDWYIEDYTNGDTRVGFQAEVSGDAMAALTKIGFRVISEKSEELWADKPSSFPNGTFNCLVKVGIDPPKSVSANALLDFNGVYYSSNTVTLTDIPAKIAAERAKYASSGAES